MSEHLSASPGDEAEQRPGASAAENSLCAGILNRFALGTGFVSSRRLGCSLPLAPLKQTASVHFLPAESLTIHFSFSFLLLARLLTGIGMNSFLIHFFFVEPPPP